MISKYRTTARLSTLATAASHRTMPDKFWEVLLIKPSSLLPWEIKASEELIRLLEVKMMQSRTSFTINFVFDRKVMPFRLSAFSIYGADGADDEMFLEIDPPYNGAKREFLSSRGRTYRYEGQLEILNVHHTEKRVPEDGTYAKHLNTRNVINATALSNAQLREIFHTLLIYSLKCKRDLSKGPGLHGYATQFAERLDYFVNVFARLTGRQKPTRET